MTASTLTSASQKTASNNVCPPSVAPHCRKASSHLPVVPRSHHTNNPTLPIDARSQDGDERHHEEHGVQRSPTKILALDGLLPPDQQVEYAPPMSASTAERTLSGSVQLVENARPNATGTELLEDHGPGVTEGQSVLVAPDPDHELNFSGSSVANGASTSAMRPTGNPADSEVLHGRHEEVGPGPSRPRSPEAAPPRPISGPLTSKACTSKASRAAPRDLPAGLDGPPDVACTPDQQDC